MPNSRGTHTYDFARPSVTADIVVVTLEAEPHVLLIRRGDEPFKGAWALPGGFVDPDEPLAAAAERELQEETGLTGIHLEQLGAFGDPGRDPRGWTVTVAFIARVERSRVEPKAGDDASELDWHLLSKLPSNLAFDHDKILARAQARIAANTA